MRVLSNVEVMEVSGAGWVDDALEALKNFFGYGSSNSGPPALVCSNNTVTNGSTSTTTSTCSNGISTTVVIGEGYSQTHIVTPGTNVDGSVGYKYIGGQITYTAPPTVTVSTVINGSSTTSR